MHHLYHLWVEPFLGWPADLKHGEKSDEHQHKVRVVRIDVHRNNGMDKCVVTS